MSKVSIVRSLYAFSEAFALPVEKEFTPEKYIKFAADNWNLCFALVIGYVVVVFGGKTIMNKREPFDLKGPLAFWNALLSIFSTIGMCRTLPWLIANLLENGFQHSVCHDAVHTWAAGPTGMWVMFFIYSKIPELLDTVFIVLRKKPLIFLHWYHHITVLMFCWSAYSTMAGSGLFFVGMNFSVHAMMYGYYCLQALNCCPKAFPPVLITIAQILQMFVGTGVCISCWYYVLNGTNCSNDFNNLVAGALMYGSYLYLFCEFAVKRYIFKSSSKKSDKKSD